MTLKTRYGRFLGRMRGEMQKLDGAAVVAAFERGETVTLTMDNTEIVLSKEDVLVEAVKKEGYTSQVDGALTVVLDTNLTPDLIDEGYAREMISRVQAMRKDAGLDVTDRISVTVETTDKAKSALEHFSEMVRKAVLAVALTFAPASDAAFVRENDLNGEKATIGIEKA